MSIFQRGILNGDNPVQQRMLSGVVSSPFNIRMGVIFHWIFHLSPDAEDDTCTLHTAALRGGLLDLSWDPCYIIAQCPHIFLSFIICEPDIWIIIMVPTHRERQCRGRDRVLAAAGPRKLHKGQGDGPRSPDGRCEPLMCILGPRNHTPTSSDIWSKLNCWPAATLWSREIILLLV